MGKCLHNTQYAGREAVKVVVVQVVSATGITSLSLTSLPQTAVSASSTGESTPIKNKVYRTKNHTLLIYNNQKKINIKLPKTIVVKKCDV